MDVLLLVLGVGTLSLWLVVGVQLVKAKKAIRFLKDCLPVDDASCPSISVIIPAKDEERNLEKALQSVLRLDYPKLEIHIVNDRSTDGTGTILERMATEYPHLRVEHLRKIPHGWLGKNYALHYAAQTASGEFLLFTDADVVMHRCTLKKAMKYVSDHQLDHLTVAPEDTMHGVFLKTVAAVFGFLFLLVFQPWKARDPKSHKHIGIGAFNLLRASTYHAVGGHQTIAMRPDDDVKLGKIIKAKGYRQDLLSGREMVLVEWYASVNELIQGLMKNSFAGVEYRLSLLIVLTVASLLFHIWPFVGVAITRGLVQMVNGSIVALVVCLFWYTMHPYGTTFWRGLLYPIAVFLVIYIQWRSAIIAVWNGGITWRGTHYSLASLKANKV